MGLFPLWPCGDREPHPRFALLEGERRVAEGLEASLIGLVGGGRLGEIFSEQTDNPMQMDRPVVFDVSNIDDSETLRTTHTTEDLVEGRDELARILEGVKDLPDDRREALIMRFALGMDNREIARAMGRTDGATKVLLHRAIKQLEEIVATRPAA